MTPAFVFDDLSVDCNVEATGVMSGNPVFVRAPHLVSAGGDGFDQWLWASVGQVEGRNREQGGTAIPFRVRIGSRVTIRRNRRIPLSQREFPRSRTRSRSFSPDVSSPAEQGSLALEAVHPVIDGLADFIWAVLLQEVIAVHSYFRKVWPRPHKITLRTSENCSRVCVDEKFGQRGA